VVQWFNNCNQSSFTPSNQEYLFGIFSNPANKELEKFNYTLLFAHYFIYTNKLHNNSLLITDFVSKISSKYRLENFNQNLHAMMLPLWSTLVKSLLLLLNLSLFSFTIA